METTASSKRYALHFLRRFRLLHWLAIALLSPVVLITIGLAGNHAADYRANADVERWYAQPPRPLPDDQNNAFFAFLGLWDEGDAVAKGHLRWARVAAAARDGRAAEQVDEQYLQLLPSCNQQTNCILWLSTQPAALRLLQENEAVLGRYDALLTYKTWSRPLLPRATMDYSMFDVLNRGKLRRLWLLKQYKRWQAGERSGVLRSLEADIRLWREATEDATLLIDAAVAAGFVSQDFEFLAHIIKLYPHETSAHTAALQSILMGSLTENYQPDLMLWGETRAIWQDITQPFGSLSARKGWEVLVFEPLVVPNNTRLLLQQLAVQLEQKMKQSPTSIEIQQNATSKECANWSYFLFNPIAKASMCTSDYSAFFWPVIHLQRAEEQRLMLVDWFKHGGSPSTP